MTKIPPTPFHSFVCLNEKKAVREKSFWNDVFTENNNSLGIGDSKHIPHRYFLTAMERLPARVKIIDCGGMWISSSYHMVVVRSALETPLG